MEFIHEKIDMGYDDLDRAEHAEVLKPFERVRCASYDDTRIGSSKRQRWRRGVLASMCET